MRTSMSLTLMLALAMLPRPAAAQEDAPTPWEEWRPPEVQMPEPNAWDIYLLAGELEDAIHRRLREEAGLPVPDPEADAPAQFPPGVDPNVRTQLDMTEQSLEPETLARLIHEYAPVFSALEAAIAGDAQVPPLRTEADIEDAFSTFATVRQFARMFAGRSVHHLQNEHALSAALDGIAAMRVGADCGTGRTMTSGLVQEACVAIGEARLHEAIRRLTGDEARIAMNALRGAMSERADFADIMEGEAIFSKTYFVRVTAAVMPGQDDLEALEEQGQEIPEGAVTVEGTWEALTSFQEAQLAEARKPWWQREALPTSENPLVSSLGGSFERAGHRFVYTDARLRVALTALAAQAFRGDTGSYPASLEQLVPEYLPEVPRDPFIDAPLRSVARDPVSRAHPGSSRPPTGAGVLTIYSVGYDQDDDGGVDVGNRIEEDGDIALTLGGG